MGGEKVLVPVAAAMAIIPFFLVFLVPASAFVGTHVFGGSTSIQVSVWIALGCTRDDTMRGQSKHVV